ncbi:MAG TPA: cytochrome P450 [Steroidobacteraceae bacterium]|nr:cytochrome P450 [Steroidobacteraceae bacterium]
MNTSAIPTRRLAGLAPPPLKPASFLKTIRAARGNAFEIIPLRAYEQPVYLSKTLLGTLLMVNDPEGVRRVLLDNVANYPKNDLEIEFFSAMFGEGLLSAPHAKWRTHRKVMAPSFGTRTVESYAPAMVETTVAFARHWDALPDFAEMDIAEEMKALTLKIICRTMFSSDADELAACSQDALDFAQGSLEFGLLDVLPVIGPRRMKRTVDAIRAHFKGVDAAIYRLIGEREKIRDEAPKDFLTRLVAAKDPDDGAGLNATEVRDEVITIFMAGHETTAVAMTWVWYLLSQHPSEEAKLHTELDAVLAGRAPTAEDLPNLPYTRMIIEEAMRIYPPAPGMSIREAKEADEVCGFKVTPGLQMMISPWVLHRHRRLWDNPEQFDPTRFSKEASEKRPRFAYLPFGGGPRVCIGATLAMTEATLILAVLAQRFRLRLKEQQHIKLQARITLRPENGMMTILERRGAPARCTAPASDAHISGEPSLR